jgi:hypothetical protein
MSEVLIARRRKTEPLLDELGRAIAEGREQVAYLWQVMDDASALRRVGELLEVVKASSSKKGRREMPALCEELLVALREPPGQQQVDVLRDGFERLYRLWSGAKSGIMV